MAHALYHARSSARKFGGTADDYIEYHAFMDHTKAHIADARHRLVLHNTWGIFFVERIFGKTFTRKSDGKEMPLRPILEQHVLEDFGRIPTLEVCLAGMTLAPWMYKNATPLSVRLEEGLVEGQETQAIMRDEVLMADIAQGIREIQEGKGETWETVKRSLHVDTQIYNT